MIGDHLCEAFSHVSPAGQEQIDLPFGGSEKFFMYSRNGFFHVRSSNYCGNVFFRGSLGDGPDGDVTSSDGFKHAAAGSRLVFHVIAYKTDNGIAAFHFQWFHFLEGYFVSERFIGRPPCFFGIFFIYGYQHGMYGRCLGNENDVDLLLGKGVEQTAGITGNAYHAASFHG